MKISLLCSLCRTELMEKKLYLNDKNNDMIFLKQKKTVDNSESQEERHLCFLCF